MINYQILKVFISGEEYMTVVGRVISLLQAALHNNPSNNHYFETQV